jgi:hypothetical protein
MGVGVWVDVACREDSHSRMTTDSSSLVTRAAASCLCELESSISWRCIASKNTWLPSTPASKACSSSLLTDLVAILL